MRFDAHDIQVVAKLLKQHSVENGTPIPHSLTVLRILREYKHYVATGRMQEETESYYRSLVCYIYEAAGVTWDEKVRSFKKVPGKSN